MFNQIKKTKLAIIYCRVSSDRQVNEGNGLVSQEKRCRDYAEMKGYKVKKVFHDEGISGGLFDRPAMHNLIAYLDEQPLEQFVIIFDDMSRFARDVKVHIQLKSELVGRGALLECLNFNFDDSPEGEFAEMIVASSNQLQRKQNRRTVCQKMKARLEKGCWCFCTPPALKNIPHPIHKRILNGLIQPTADIFKQAIEKYANDQLNTLEEIQEFINLQYKLNKISKEISINGVQRILRNALYAGWIEYKPWGVPLQKGIHNGFITKQTFDIVQAKLLGKSKPRLRKDYRLDFPLRTSVLCASCGDPLTASWTKGKLRKHPYYWCKNEKDKCSMLWKTIRTKDIHDSFETLLTTKKPSQDLIELSKVIFNEVWGAFKADDMQVRSIYQEKTEELNKNIKNLTERISKTTNENLIPIYEKELEKLAKERENIQSEHRVDKYTDERLGTMYKKVTQVLEDPIGTWRSDDIEEKRTVLFMYFDQRIRYDRQYGFGTPKTACAINLIHSMSGPKSHLVEMPGIEPGSEETRLQKYSEA